VFELLDASDEVGLRKGGVAFQKGGQRGTIRRGDFFEALDGTGGGVIRANDFVKDEADNQHQQD
jgi:hypothetical protein